MMRTITRTATGMGILVLVALASVTAFVPTGVCDERGCVDECGDGEVPGDAMGGGGEAPASTADGLFRTYDANRDLIESENEMINHRMMWLLTIQGLLFASFFLVWRGKKIGDEDGEIRAKEIYTIYALGVFSAVSVGIVLFFRAQYDQVHSGKYAGGRHAVRNRIEPWSGTAMGSLPAAVEFAACAVRGGVASACRSGNRSTDFPTQLSRHVAGRRFR